VSPMLQFSLLLALGEGALRLVKGRQEPSASQASLHGVLPGPHGDDRGRCPRGPTRCDGIAKQPGWMRGLNELLSHPSFDAEVGLARVVNDSGQRGRQKQPVSLVVGAWAHAAIISRPGSRNHPASMRAGMPDVESYRCPGRASARHLVVNGSQLAAVPRYRDHACCQCGLAGRCNRHRRRVPAGRNSMPGLT
jgi:hypothetical protein